MKRIALAVLFAVVSFAIQTSPTLAQQQISDASALPAFVPSAGQTKYALAVRENNSTGDAAREAAEALSAKFADITTGSIAKSDGDAAPVSAAQAPPVPAPQPAQRPVADPVKPTAQSTEARSIVIAANQLSGEADVKKQHAPRSKGSEAAHKIPRAVVAKETRDRDQAAGRESLVAIGQKVSFFERLMNPALWNWPTQ
jgi:hypothetical protein